MTLLFRILYIYIYMYICENKSWVGENGGEATWAARPQRMIFKFSNPDKPNTTLLVPDAGLHIEIIKLCHFENFLS